MKKIWIACWLIITALSTMQAQQKEQWPRFKAAIIAGMNLSQVDGDDKAGYRKIGLNTGIQGIVVLHPRWELSLDMLLSQRGSNSNVDLAGNTLFWHFNYVEVPVMVSFLDWKQLDKKNRPYMKVKASFGFSYARLLGGFMEQPKGVRISDQIFLDKYRPNDFSVVVGAGIFFTRNIGMDIRWSNSMSSIVNRSYNSGPEWHRMITARGIYMF
jgi:hypothetical protein